MNEPLPPYIDRFLGGHLDTRNIVFLCTESLTSLNRYGYLRYKDHEVRIVWHCDEFYHCSVEEPWPRFYWDRVLEASQLLLRVVYGA